MKHKGSAEWTPIYMMIVMVIAAILIYTLVKPMMSRASEVASGNLEESGGLLKTALFLIRNSL